MFTVYGDETNLDDVTEAVALNEHIWTTIIWN